jgi:hypothetical protein
MTSAGLARALVDSLDDEALDHLAALLAPRLSSGDRADAWVDVNGAARHLACDKRRIYDLAAGRGTNGFPVHRDGRRLLFKPSDLDEWVTR